MIKRTLFVTVLIFLLMGILPAAAQDTAWEITLLDTGTGQLYSVTPDGIQPTLAISGYQDFDSVFQPAATPDGQKMVFVGLQSAEDAPSVMGVYVADLTTGECCTQLPDPIPSGMTQATIGTFSPDGTQVAAFISNPLLGGDAEAVTSGFITIYDLTDNSIAANLPPAMLEGAEQPTFSVAFGNWDETGLRVAPLCFNCENPDEGVYQAWDPATDTLTPVDEVYNANYRILPATGEILYTVANENFPSSAQEGAVFVPPNVVMYRPDSAPEGEASVIYFNPNATIVSSASWVLDGSAVLVTHPDSTIVTLLYRDGSQTLLELGAQAVALTGTPDGWLMIDQNQLVFYSIVDNQFIAVPLGELSGRIAVLQQPTIGSSAMPGFAPLP